MTEHEEPERAVEEMEERSEKLEQEIDDAREDWDAKKRDPAVPGAAGDPESADEDLAPEADYPSKGE
jgi:hypothetical protein